MNCDRLETILRLGREVIRKAEDLLQEVRIEAEAAKQPTPMPAHVEVEESVQAVKNACARTIQPGAVEKHDPLSGHVVRFPDSDAVEKLARELWELHCIEGTKDATKYRWENLADGQRQEWRNNATHVQAKIDEAVAVKDEQMTQSMNVIVREAVANAELRGRNSRGCTSCGVSTYSHSYFCDACVRRQIAASEKETLADHAKDMMAQRCERDSAWWGRMEVAGLAAKREQHAKDVAFVRNVSFNNAVRASYQEQAAAALDGCKPQ